MQPSSTKGWGLFGLYCFYRWLSFFCFTTS